MKQTADKNRNRRRMGIAVCIVLLLGAVSAALLSHPEWFVYKGKDDAPATMYSDTVRSFSFYEPDYDLNVEEDEYYMGLDRYIHIQRGGENIAVTDGDFAAWGAPIEFFHRYFTAAIYADVETYNSLFTEKYYLTANPYEFFAPQRIFGITVEQLSAENTAAGTKYVYNVTYAIHKNDGTFRNDIDSDAFKTLIFTLVPDGDTLKIDAIDYYRQK